MRNARGDARLSQSMRQSFVGLTVLVALGLFGAVVLWVQNFSLGGRSYKATIQFPNAGGMTVGTNVAYRGVKVGQVLSVIPEPAGVAVEIEIWPADRLIPSNSRVEATQAGLVGETSIDITPLQLTPLAEDIALPLDLDCDPALIICNGSRLTGEGQLDVNTLIRSLLKISNTLSDPEVTASIREIAQNASDALAEIAALGNEVTDAIQEARENRVLETAITSIGQAADEINLFLASNRGTLVATLDSLKGTSDQIQVTVADLRPILNRVEQGELLDDLEALSANAAEASANIRDLTTELNHPTNLLLLQQTLESARSVFENIQKITSDVDEVTGSPQFRQDVMRLIEALSDLLSSTQLLYQQVQYAQLLQSSAAAVTGGGSSSSPPLTSGHSSLANPSLQFTPGPTLTGGGSSVTDSLTSDHSPLANPPIQPSAASSLTGSDASGADALTPINPHLSDPPIQP